MGAVDWGGGPIGERTGLAKGAAYNAAGFP